MAQREAKKLGITFNFKRLSNNLQRQYGKKVENAIENTANNAKNTYAKASNSKQNKQFQKQASQATFNGVITRIQNQVKKQLNQVPNKQAKDNLIALLNNGAKQAREQLKKQQLLDQNIKNTVNAALPKVQGEGAKLQKQIDE